MKSKSIGLVLRVILKQVTRSLTDVVNNERFSKFKNRKDN